MNGCPPRVKLLQMLHDGEHVPHLAACPSCAEFVKAAAAVLSLTGDADELRRGVAEEVDELIAGEPAHRIASILVRTPALHRSIVIRELLARADRLYGSNPRQALDFTSAAVRLCEVLRAARAIDPALYVDVLKEHASVQRRLGWHDAALETLANAWTLTAETVDGEHLRAVLMVAMAIVYAEPDIARFDEAMALAEQAAAVLETCGDARRAMIAQHTRAHVLAVMGKDDLAAQIMERVILNSGSLSPHDLAIAHDLAAHCLVNLGRFDEARQHAAEAASRYVETGDIVGEATVAHMAARASAALGGFEEARLEFERTAEVIFAVRLFDAWTIMRLDYVAAALQADPTADLRHTLEAVARVCYSSPGSAERRRHAAEALDYLRRLAVRDALTAESVKCVRAFMARNTAQPPVKFTPPFGGDFVM